MRALISDRRTIRYLLLYWVSCITVAMALLACESYGQVIQSPSKLDLATARAKSGNVDASDVETIAKNKAVGSIPALEAQFAETTDLAIKTKIAAGLVRLGDNDLHYWEFLLQRANFALDSDLPDPFRDSQGNSTGRQLSPKFRAYMQTHNLDASTAVAAWTYELPGIMLDLGETGDPRGIPLLQQALHSRNYLIVVFAAKGLTLIQDKQSIPLIVAAIQNAPPEYQPLIAEPLIYFNDPQAQSAVDAYVPKEKAMMAREGKAQGRGVFGW